jgi:hypothetical protein
MAMAGFLQSSLMKSDAVELERKAMPLPEVTIQQQAISSKQGDEEEYTVVRSKR